MDIGYLWDLILHHHLPNGGWLDVWLKREEAIGEFIRAEKLKPASSATVPTLVGEIPTGIMDRKASVAALKIRDPGICGGIRVPHLHFDGKVYVLKEEQWAKFSGGIIADAKAKLSNVNAVNFDQAMDLTRVSQALT